MSRRELGRSRHAGAHVALAPKPERNARGKRAVLRPIVAVLACFAIVGLVFVMVANPNMQAVAEQNPNFSNVTDRFAGAQPQSIDVAASYTSQQVQQDTFVSTPSPTPTPTPTPKPIYKAPKSTGSSGGSGGGSGAFAPSAPAPSPGTAQAYAEQQLTSMGMGSDQFSCLVSLWNRESGWNVHAANPSGAYGIPQALPGSKMSSAGPDWQDSYQTQINWGLGYVMGRYGSPCGAWGHSQSTGWY